MSETIYDQLVHSNAVSCGLGRWKAPPGRLRRVFRNTVHSTYLTTSYSTDAARARFLATIDLTGKRRCRDRQRHIGIGRSTGRSYGGCARHQSPGGQRRNRQLPPNGLGDRVTATRSDLMSALAPGFLFDVIISNPPFFSGEPRDVADRAWVAGPGYRDIVSLFERAHERLKPSGTMYVLLSSDSDLHFLGQLIARAGFRARMATAFSIMIESMIIYELTRLEPVVATAPSIGQSTDYFVPHQGATDELNRVPA